MNNLDLKEIHYLEDLLCHDNIPFRVEPLFDGLHLIYFSSLNNQICSVICHKYSYGHEEGLLEIKGLVDEEKVGDSVEGYLTAQDVYRRIKEHYYMEKIMQEAENEREQKFSLKKFIKWAKQDLSIDEIVDDLKSGTNWYIECDGLTAKEMAKLGYVTNIDWME